MKLPKNPLLGLLLILPVLCLPLIGSIWPPDNDDKKLVFLVWLYWTGIALVITIYLHSRSQKKD